MTDQTTATEGLQNLHISEESIQSHGINTPLEAENHSEDDDDHVKKCLQRANELKLEGNDCFRSKRWDEALAAYKSGLGHLPKRKETKPKASSKPSEETDTDKGKGKQREHLDDEEAESSEGAATKAAETAPEPSELEKQCAKARAVFNANIGACYVKLGDHKEAVTACTEALLDDPVYVKALQRRAASNETVNSWSSLASAQEDYNTLLKLLSPTSPEVPQIQRSLRFLGPRVEEAQKRETAEMLGKLKGMGNSILGNFGLSTDNFKFEPNGQGGYSMNFTR